MEYRNWDSVKATIISYSEALDKILEYCPNVEPSSNEFNSRTVLPTAWRPVGPHNAARLRKDANYLWTGHAKLLDWGRAKYLAKGYWDYDSFFKVSWQLRVPFHIYVWEPERTTYPKGFDEEGNPRGKPRYTPPVMREWCSPQYVCLGEISSRGMKTWALPDWWSKHSEIESFMDDNPNLKAQYREAVKKADEEVQKWQIALQVALQEMSRLTTIFNQEKKE